MKNNVILEKSYAFALKIVEVCKVLRGLKEYELSGQLFRSGTSIGANVEEATAAQSRNDFVAKMAIASKEARETNYWLRLLRDSGLSLSVETSDLIADSEDLIRLLTAIVKTSQRKDNKGNFEF